MLISQFSYGHGEKSGQPLWKIFLFFNVVWHSM